MSATDEWGGKTPDQISRLKRDRLAAKARARREAYRKRVVISAPQIEMPEPSRMLGIGYRDDGTKFYQVKRDGQEISLPFISIQRVMA